jgi:flagellar L-ring protein precursor FlgH
MKAKLKFTFKLTVLVVGFAWGAHAAFAGSLWREGYTEERGMFADKRAKRVGDIVTIVVSESASLTNNLDLKTNKESKAGIEGFLSNLVNQFITGIPNTLLGRLQKNTNSVVIPSLPTLPVSGANSYTGGGEIDNKQTITARSAVQVIDVLPNGNLVVEGTREISFSKERQFVSLHGIIRPYDIQPDNTVASSNVADAQIQVVSEGTLTDAQRKGWLLRINDKINPF